MQDRRGGVAYVSVYLNKRPHILEPRIFVIIAVRTSDPKETSDFY